MGYDFEFYRYNFSVTNEETSLLQFVELFKDDDVCLHLLFLKRFKDALCQKCEAPVLGYYNRIISRRSYNCRRCATQIYPTKGTIFEKSTTPLSKWFYIMYNTSISKKNISAIQATKNIESTYVTAHRLMKNIRGCLSQEYFGKLNGIVEIDEAFLGAGTKWSRWGNICKTRKQPVLGFLERETGKVIVTLIDKRDIFTLDEIIQSHVQEGATIYTDGWAGYKNLYKKYTHDYVEHSRNEYARGNVHTNSMENFWGIMKRTIRGAHVKVGYHYVQNYIDEIVWKYNNRRWFSLERFDDLLNRALSTSLQDISHAPAEQIKRMPTRKILIVQLDGEQCRCELVAIDKNILECGCLSENSSFYEAGEIFHCYVEDVVSIEGVSESKKLNFINDILENNRIT